MAKENSVIETGVDKLVELVRAKKRISVQEAARKLGVGPIVVEEWADFLEEEKVISIEYKFATEFLIERILNPDEIKNKEKEFHGHKEEFVRKAEVALAILDRESEDFLKFKNSFEKLKKELSFELKHVQPEVKQLEKLENHKKNIDKQISEHEKDFHKKLHKFEADINREQQRYKEVFDKDIQELEEEIKKEEKKHREMIESINYEEDKIKREISEGLSLKEKEGIINRKLSRFEKDILAINQAIEEGRLVMEHSKKRIENLNKLAEEIKKELVSKKELAAELLKESEDKKKKISEIQKEILEKIEKDKQKISEEIGRGKSPTKKFREFFNKKSEIEKLIHDMDAQKDQLEYELISLIKKAKVFHLSSSTLGLKDHTKELEEKFEKIKKKKDKFEEEVVRLGSLLRE